MSFAEQLEVTWPAQFVANHAWNLSILEMLLPLPALHAWLMHHYVSDF